LVEIISYATQIQLIVLLLSGIIGAKIAERIRIPIIIPLLLTGYFIGPFSPIGLTIFNPLELGVSLETVTHLLIPLILFYEGMAFDIEMFKRIIRPVFSLATLGVVVSAILFAGVGYYILKLDFVTSILIGTAVSATDVAAIGVIMAGLTVKKEIVSTLIGESAFNDALVIVLITILLGMIEGEGIELGFVIVEFFRQFMGGVLLGYTMGIVIGAIVDRLKMKEHLLYFSLILFLATYTLSTFILTTYSFVNPAVAVVVSGIVFRHYFAPRGVVPIEGLDTLSFWENIVFIAEIIIFMTLGAAISIEGLISNAFTGLILMIIALFVVRPIAVFISTIGFAEFTLNEKLFISLAGARGIVSAAVANLILISSIANADVIFNIILIITLSSLLFVGFGGKYLAFYLCKIGVSPIHLKYEKLKSQYIALQDVLRELELKYQEGLIDIRIYRILSRDVQMEMEKLDMEMHKLYEDEEMKRMVELEAIKLKRDLVRIKLRAIKHLNSKGEISTETYEDLKETYTREMEELDKQLTKLMKPSKKGKKK
jgi:cell volume regulation protein A